MIDEKALVGDLKRQVKVVEADLARQVKAMPEVETRLRTEYDSARKIEYTAARWNPWLAERVTQVAVAWVLGTVFVRFCEDNRLISEPYLAAKAEDRRELIQARYEEYVEEDPDPTYRGWLERAFEELREGQAGRLLFDRRYNPLHQIPISHDGARSLIEFWRERIEADKLVHDFEDLPRDNRTNGLSTRFLGSLYQDLSENARKKYALLQTPEIVQEFILDRTMVPAVREFGFEELKMIDPTCGSGHFVLGAFWRLVRLWRDSGRAVELHECVRKALVSVHGVDINPFAVAIARFRLLIAAMAASGVQTLAEAATYEWPIQLAIGDSLLKSRQLEIELFAGTEKHGEHAESGGYEMGDLHEFPGILEVGRYHVVVGNPPYITVADKNINEAYRQAYSACEGTYALSVPFAQRFFELAKRGDAEGYGYGIVGQITANSFMKREFGTKLIENYFAHEVELTEVIDTSGAHIPGHGTPTVILIGRPRRGSVRTPMVRTVRSVQGEPFSPESGDDGFVWRAIIEQIDKPGSMSQWVSVDELERSRYFAKQPWVLVDGGLEMIELMNKGASAKLATSIDEVGAGAITREDSAYMIGQGALRRHGIPTTYQRSLVGGGVVRDFLIHEPIVAVWPYKECDLSADAPPSVQRLLWPSRVFLRDRVAFGKTQLERGLEWFEYSMFFRKRYVAPLSIAFPFVATHNHFTLNREKRVFIRTAPIIKLREEASQDDHLRLLGLLNSSTACFWLKMVSHSKGNGGVGGGISDERWEHRFEFTGTKLEEFPLPARYPISAAADLDKLAQRLAGCMPSAVTAADVPTAPRLREAHSAWESIRVRMIALQEELDWQVYALYNLHPEDLRAPNSDDVPELALGERAFEIVLARRVAVGEASGEWFKRHNSTPITALPAHWPAAYCEVVRKRIDLIESSRAIGMIERPEYKRRWATEGWDSLQNKALRSWLLDRIEAREHWFDASGQPAILAFSHLVDALSRDAEFVSVAAIYAPRKDLPAVVSSLMTDEHVPFLAALRYKPSGVSKRQDWEEVWNLQRQEDAAVDEPAKKKIRDSIPVPPKYTSADFLRTSYWQSRGKLDVPKERFISYGQTNAAIPELYGWAGWDHREQAHALATYFTNTPLSDEEVAPFLAGLLEIQPWLGQWYHEFDQMYGGSPADFFDGYRLQKQGEHGLTDDDLRAWRPTTAIRGRRAVKTAIAAATERS